MKGSEEIMRPVAVVPSPNMAESWRVEQAIQKAQFRRNFIWRTKEGGNEGPTHQETYDQECQQRRIAWLVKECQGITKILECGCNWGYVLDKVNGRMGIDINLENIALAQERFPNREFRCQDVTWGLGYSGSYDIVLLAEILEHLPWDKVRRMVTEALKVAREKVLITLPLEEVKATNFKHRWVPTWFKVAEIAHWYPYVCIEADRDFFYIKFDKEAPDAHQS